MPEQCGACLPRSSLCGQQCVPWQGYWNFAQQPAGDQETFEGTVTDLTEDNAVVTPAGGDPVTFAYSLPSRDEVAYRLPLAVGDKVSLEVLEPTNISGIWDASVTIRDQQGTLLFAAARAFERPVSIDGVTVEAVDVGCTNGDIGDCIATRYAMALITDGRGCKAQRTG